MMEGATNLVTFVLSLLVFPEMKTSADSSEGGYHEHFLNSGKCYM
jgi:hypothetical protein